jgi:hypothetical protein
MTKIIKNLIQSPFKDILIGAEEKSQQLPAVLKSYCEENEIRLFNAGDVVQTSPVDGVHWEPEEHRKLGQAIAPDIRAMLKDNLVQ